jgi:Ca2+-binding RTX toxin-like protein
MRPFPRGIGATALTAALLLVVASPASAAFTSCTYVGGTVTATTDFSPSFGTLSVDGGVIEADATPCGEATVANTDLILVVDGPGLGDPQIRIDLSGGAFAPGATDEADGSSEIEIDVTLTDVNLPAVEIVGTAGADHVVAGSLGMNLNAAEAADDVDVTFALVGGDPLGVIDRLIGLTADDVLSNAGGEGTGAPWPSSTPLIDGGPGNDRLLAGTEDALLVGGAGSDELVGGPDELDTLRGGPGADVLSAGPGGDVLDGEGGADLLAGGGGDDELTGGAGTDVVLGGAGADGFATDDDQLDVVLGGPGPDAANADLAGDGSPVVDLLLGVETTT